MISARGGRRRNPATWADGVNWRRRGLAASGQRGSSATEIDGGQREGPRGPIRIGDGGGRWLELAPATAGGEWPTRKHGDGDRQWAAWRVCGCG